MSWLSALWLGIVQGLTEFLPVSSSGHLVVFQTLLGAHADGGLVFEIALHVATLVAIAVFYRRRIVRLVIGAATGSGDAWRYVGKLAVGTLPAVAVGLLLKHWIESVFHSPVVSGVGLLVTGAILWTTRRTLPEAAGEEPGWADAFWIGCAQAFAIWPGVSRSGTTVSAALALGVRPDRAAEFSFLLGIIAIAGAAVLTLPDLEAASSETLSAVMVGGVAALVAGVAAIWLFIRLLRAKVFHAFAYYTWAVGLVFLGWLAFRG